MQNRALWLVRYLGLSAANHVDEQNGCQSFVLRNAFSFLFFLEIITSVFILKQLFASGSVIVGK